MPTIQVADKETLDKINLLTQQIKDYNGVDGNAEIEISEEVISMVSTLPYDFYKVI